MTKQRILNWHSDLIEKSVNPIPSILYQNMNPTAACPIQSIEIKLSNRSVRKNRTRIFLSTIFALHFDHSIQFTLSDAPNNNDKQYALTSIQNIVSKFCSKIEDALLTFTT